MKFISFFLFLLTTNYTFSQVDPVASKKYNRSGDVVVYSTPNEIKGSNYLFKTWENKNVIHYKEGNQILKNININVKDNNFEFKISEKSVLIIDPKNIEYITINYKNYKFYSFEGSHNKIFEIVALSKKIEILKSFEIYFVKGIANPVITNPIDKYVLKTRYHIKKEDKISDFKLKKKRILSIFSDKKDEITKYVKKNKLSYKKEKDVKQIFSYYSSL
ncbi:MAG TPA: hypothetical protein EYG92_07345 [Lutibacter sp.]|nr:hypothetical protein [Lutibacter sp.]